MEDYQFDVKSILDTTKCNLVELDRKEYTNLTLGDGRTHLIRSMVTEAHFMKIDTPRFSSKQETIDIVKL